MRNPFENFGRTLVQKRRSMKTGMPSWLDPPKKLLAVGLLATSP